MPHRINLSAIAGYPVPRRHQPTPQADETGPLPNPYDDTSRSTTSTPASHAGAGHSPLARDPPAPIPQAATSDPPAVAFRGQLVDAVVYQAFRGVHLARLGRPVQRIPLVLVLRAHVYTDGVNISTKARFRVALSRLPFRLDSSTSAVRGRGSVDVEGTGCRV